MKGTRGFMLTDMFQCKLLSKGPNLRLRWSAADQLLHACEAWVLEGHSAEGTH
jgi:hypothetical protein